MARPIKHITQLNRQIFMTLGLSDKEALLYDTLLSIGTASGSTLENKTSLKKNTYALLDSLIKKGLVLLLKKDGKRAYQPTPPEHLLTLLTKQEETVQQTKTALTTLLPRLTSQYALTVGKPTVRYYEGEEGLQEVFTDIYSPKNEPVYGCVDFEKADTVFPEHIAKDLIPIRIQNKLKAISFIADSPKARQIQKKDKEQIRESILLDKEDYPLPAEIDIYEDKIAMLSFEKEKFIGIIIQNEAFATTLKSIFKKAFSP